MILRLNNMTVSVDFEKGEIESLKLFGKERLTSKAPLFRVRLRNRSHEITTYSSYDAQCIKVTEEGAEYSDFTNGNLKVIAGVKETRGECEWHISVTPLDDKHVIEWVDFPIVKLPKLKDNNTENNGGEILFPYNEGALVSDNNKRCKGWIKHREPVYPSEGIYAVFPNMICSQMQSYIFDDASLYIGVHDPERAPKQIDFYEEDGAIVMLTRLFSGVNFGEAYKNEYPIIFSALGPRWEDSAERYRAWFEENLPPRVKKIAENKDIPKWYEESPLVVAYPVRGWHDMDEMKPNRLFPYINAMPEIEKIKSATGARILALIMHWEGTAPWAPPYVWPPYGGEDAFNEFADSLHARGDVLGVYCSGFGYSINSNLIPYNKEDEFNKRGLSAAMCTGADSVPRISKICTGQRSGYDICPASKLGQEILSEAYIPLFKSRADYAQILDQNHGGGQYICLSEKHGHTPSVGGWMTKNMQSMLTEWNEMGKEKVFGCESAASEAFIGNLLFNDNRFELNYIYGRPIPLYAYIYHEYIRNFMGNQVCCPFPSEVDTLCYRLAYSYSIGDSMSITLTPNADLLSSWSTRDFENLPNKEKAYRFIKNLTELYNNGTKKYLYDGRMIKGEKMTCESVTFDVWDGFKQTYPELHTAAYEAKDGSRVQIVVNPYDEVKKCKIGDKDITVSPLSAALIPLN